MLDGRILEVTWTEGEDLSRAGPRLRIEPADPAQHEPDVPCHEAVLDVCDNPRCECANIQLQFQRGGTRPRQPGDCWLDLNTKSLVLTPAQETDPECLALAKIIREELTDADQRRLREWFLAEKLELIQTTPISKIDIADLPDAEDGRMVGFVEVFPAGLALYFNLDNQVWAADEQYCVQPGCTCKETILSFLKLASLPGGKLEPIRHPPAIRYNYQTHKARPASSGPVGSPPPEFLLAALMRSQATVDMQLGLRHLIMQALYARHAIEQTKAHLRAIETPRPPKVGRNEPCPCGSGRKYKRCCIK